MALGALGALPLHRLLPPAAACRQIDQRCVTVMLLHTACCPPAATDVEQALSADLGFDNEFERFKAAAALVR